MIIDNGSINPVDCLRNKTQTNEEIFNIDDVKNNMYPVCVPCDNCGNEKYYTLPKGCTIRSYLKNEDCIVCKCKIVRQRITKK